ncbi:sulfurtransferase [Glaciihabitans arcticus]|uniref:sulfurtransferase n=1 Tax=Glaciihabitans arcticus TaxID=2668039 RepID=UPI001386C6F0|nr:rhodanese-like domain-containing protein [Glaciihabitans arcticus]
MTGPFISVSELSDALAEPNPPIVFDASLELHAPAFDGDYRMNPGRDRWLAGHIPGSQHVDVATQFSDTNAPTHYAHPEPQQIADELARLGVSRDSQVVIYDTTGTMWAARLWYLLRWIGVSARVLDGGYKAWTAGGHTVETGERPPRPASSPWKGESVRRAWVSKEELVERAADDERPLVCSLPAGSFTGADATRYARRGRIPNSVNVSSRDLFGSNGTLKSRVELILAYDAAGVDVAENSSEVLLYCGGGISASAGALTLAAIGQKAVRIYDGSLEEWSADPALPLVTG